MNFTLCGSGGGAGHLLTGVPVTKYQQNVQPMSQVVGMMGGDGNVQYVRTLEGGAQLQPAPQIISVPIALPGAKPGDPQQTVQIQVLHPNMMQQQQPKYQMQIPIQGLPGFQQGGAVLTVQYAPDGNDPLQLLPEGLQVLATLPQELQMLQQNQDLNGKDLGQQMQQQTILIQQNPQMMMQHQHQQDDDDKKVGLNNNTNSNNNNNSIHHQITIKQEEDNDTNDDEESSETGGEASLGWSGNASQEIANYLSKLPSQQGLPVSLQQFLRLNPQDMKREGAPSDTSNDDVPSDPHNKLIVMPLTPTDDASKPKKKKKYKKKPSKPARPKPGQVTIAQAMDGTTIYCCPECSMAYPEKEQLEFHLSVHKIERRFICGICGAGLKRKEHLERHKLGHNPERPYVCGVCRKGFKRKEHLNLHTVIHSGEKTEVCQECGKGFYRKDHLRKHTRSHASRRAREESMGTMVPVAPHVDLDALAAVGTEVKPVVTTTLAQGIMPEITIHVPTSSNMQVPVQISVPHHIVSSFSTAPSAAPGSPRPLDELMRQS